MTSISSLSNWQPLARLPAATASASQRGAAGSGDPAPSSIVQLSKEGLAASRQGQADDAAPFIPTAVRFKDLGAAMLNQFKLGGPVPVQQAELPDTVDNKFTLSVVTRSGVKVDLTLASEDDSMALEVSASADLSDDERAALAGLAKGFQAAIDGMAADDPKIQLGALAGFDSKALQSVDFHASVKQATLPPSTQTLDFHADGKQRKVSIGGASGSAEVSIDTSKLDGLGTKEQQAKAIGSYLKQFDQAATRGHADGKLITMFKDAFSDLSRTATRSEERGIGLVLPGETQPGSWALSDQDHAALTGLADFSASVTQAPKWSNPLRSAEKDSFSYEVSQNTNTGGERRDDRSISQTQQSHLSAQYHQSLGLDDNPKFDVTPQSQNYYYHQIEDSADSNVELGYKDGHLVKATLQQNATQSDRVQKYLLGKLSSDKTIPGQQALVRDLLASLQPYQTGGERHETAAATEARRQQALAALGGEVYLLGDPRELAARSQRLAP